GNTLTGLTVNATGLSNSNSTVNAITAVVNSAQANLGNFLQFTTGSTTEFQVANNGAITANGNLSFSQANPIISASTSNTGLTIQAPGTGTLTLNTTGAGTVNLGTANTTTVSIGNTSSSLSLEGSNGGTIAIGNGATAHTINVGAGSGSNNVSISIGSGVTGGSNTAAVTIGSANAANSTTLVQGGNGSTAIQLQTATSGTIGIGSNGVANTIQIGQNGTASVTQSINIGNGGTGSTANITLGDSNAGTTLLQGGTSVTLSSSSSGSVVIGSVTNGVIFGYSGTGGGGAGSYEPTLLGTARHSATMNIVPQFAGSTFVAPSSLPSGCNGASGTMTASTDTTNFHNYYNWTTAAVNAQCYYIYARLTIPSNFSAWGTQSGTTTGPTIQAYDWIDNASCTVNLALWDTSNSTVSLTGSNISPSSTTTWQQNSATSSTGTYTPGSVMTVRIQLLAPPNDNARIGEISIPYLTK